MENLETSQNRHEQIIQFLHQFKQYRPGGVPILKMKYKPVGNSEVKNLTVNEINQAAIVLVDVLNLSGGSVNDVNLYRLLQTYFKIPESRKDINAVVENAKSSKLSNIKDIVFELRDQTVIATIELDEDETVEVNGVVIDVDVNTYYFHEKGEPVIITVSIDPIGELPEGIDPEYAHEYLMEIPLRNIRKA